VIFGVGSVLLVLVIVTGLLLHRRRQSPALESKKPVEDARTLYLLSMLALLSILAYILFAFGKR